MEWAIWNVLITISRLVWKMLIIYTTRLRSSQNSKMLPLIDRAYQQEKEIQQQRQRIVYYRHMYPFCFPSIDSTVCAMANEKIVLCP